MSPYKSQMDDDPDALKSALHAIYQYVIDPSLSIDHKTLAVKVLLDLLRIKSYLADTIRHQLLELGLVKEWIDTLLIYTVNEAGHETLRCDLVSIICVLALGDDLVKARLAPIIDPLFDLIHMQPKYPLQQVKSEEEAMYALWNLASGQAANVPQQAQASDLKQIIQWRTIHAL